MTAEEFLSAPSKLRAAIASHASGSRGKLEDTMLAITEEEDRIKTRIADLSELERKILDVIHQIPNALQRSVLLMRYIQGLRWMEIARKLYVCKTTVYVLHREGLKAVEGILGSRKEIS